LQDDKDKFDKAGALILGVNNNTVDAHQGYCRIVYLKAGMPTDDEILEALR